MVNVPCDHRTFSLAFLTVIVLGAAVINGEITQGKVVRMEDNVREFLVFQRPRRQLECYPMLHYTCPNDDALMCPDSCEADPPPRHVPVDPGSAPRVSFQAIDLSWPADGGQITASYNSSYLVCFPVLTHTCANDKPRICPEDCHREFTSGTTTAAGPETAEKERQAEFTAGT